MAPERGRSEQMCKDFIFLKIVVFVLLVEFAGRISSSTPELGEMYRALEFNLDDVLSLSRIRQFVCFAHTHRMLASL